jgi:hypothetical protein
LNRSGYTPVSKAGLTGTGTGVGGALVGVTATEVGIEGDPQAESRKERNSNGLRKCRNVDKDSILKRNMFESGQGTVTFAKNVRSVTKRTN